MTNMELLFVALGILTFLAIVFVIIAVHFHRRYVRVVRELEQTQSFGSVWTKDPRDRTDDSQAG